MKKRSRKKKEKYNTKVFKRKENYLKMNIVQ